MADYDRKDTFHQQAKREGYRSRAAYKLREIQRRSGILKPGARVVDLGCWPGGWLQIAAGVVGARGRVVGIDLAELESPIEHGNVFALIGDLENPADLQRVREELGGAADVLLSDAAPKLTGIKAADRARAEGLLEGIERALPALLRPGGDLLVKVLESPEARTVSDRIGKSFESRKTIVPKATRKGSSERYLLARRWRGPADLR